jgi:hypothetical protein
MIWPDRHQPPASAEENLRSPVRSDTSHNLSRTSNIPIRDRPALYASACPSSTPADCAISPVSRSASGRSSTSSSPLSGLKEHSGGSPPISSAQPQLPSPETPMEPFWSPLSPQPSTQEASSDSNHASFTYRSDSAASLRLSRSDIALTDFGQSPPVFNEDLSDGAAIDTPPQSTPAGSNPKQKEADGHGTLLDVVVEGMAQLTVAMRLDNAGRWRIGPWRRPHWVDEQYDDLDESEIEHDTKSGTETISEGSVTDDNCLGAVGS